MSETRSYEVHKLGGVSMDPEASGDRIGRNAEEIASLVRDTDRRVIVVVSAGGKDTDRILGSVRQQNPQAQIGDHDVDIALSAGEIMSVGRLSVSLRALGINDVRAFSPGQVPMRASRSDASPHALINSVDGRSILNSLDLHRVLVMPGFLATNHAGDVQTLGRGGSDLSGIALAGGVQKEAGGRVPTIFGKEVNGVYSTHPGLVQNPSLIGHMTYAQCRRVLQASEKEFIALRAAEVADALGVEMVFRRAACFIPEGSEREFAGTRISARESESVEERNGFRALPAKIFVRYDIAAQDQPRVLQAFKEKKIAFEECKPNPQGGGYELLLPNLGEEEQAARESVIRSLGITIGQPRKVYVLHFMDSRILDGTHYFTSDIIGVLQKEGLTAQVSTESDSIFIECSVEHAKQVATAVAEHFELVAK